MDEAKLDLEMERAADECLARSDQDVEVAANLLVRWIEAGSVGSGIRDRVLRDYVRSLVYDRAQH